VIPLSVRRLLRPETFFFLLCWVGLMAKFRERAFNDPGAFWHVKVGERILHDGFMHTDPFTYTFAGQTWIPQQWGGEVLMALAHMAGGLDTLLLGMVTLLAGLFTWLFSRLVGGGMHPVLAAVVCGFALFAGAYHFYARPHMATLALMAVTMAWIVDFESGRRSAWRLFALIPLFIIWTNLHGGVLGGTLTLGLAVAGWGILFLIKRGYTPIKTWRKAFLLVGIVMACTLTPFINPFGMEMLRTWQRIVGSNAMKEFVSEHQPLSIANTSGQVTVAFGAFYLIMLAGVLPRLPRVSWLIPLVWLVLTFQGIRQGPLFSVVAVVVLADFWPQTMWYRLLKKYGDSLANEPSYDRGRRWLPIPIGLVLVVFVLQLLGVHASMFGRGWARLDAKHQPVELTNELRLYAASEPNGTRIFNDANCGGFIVYHAPSLKIFMDDRFELYGDAWLRDYVKIVYSEPERIEEWADRYGFDRAIVQVEPERLPLEKYLSESPRWEVVVRGNRGAMFRRVTDVKQASAR